MYVLKQKPNIYFTNNTFLSLSLYIYIYIIQKAKAKIIYTNITRSFIFNKGLIKQQKYVNNSKSKIKIS